MTNEIKEILEALKSHNDIVKEYPLTLSIEEQKLLLDYITNLQQRIDKAVEYLIDEKREFSEDCYYKICETLEAKELLDILRGDE